MATFDVEIAGCTYRGKTASAVNQFEALHIAGRTSLITLLKEGATDMGMVAMLTRIPLEDVRRLDKLAMEGNVYVAGEEKPVAMVQFKDRIQDYYLLLAKVLRENLAGFYKLSHSTDAAPEAQQSEAAGAE